MTVPRRIAQVVGNMNGGGVEAVVMNYYRAIDRSRYQFDFFVTQSSSQIPREEIGQMGGRIFLMPSLSRPDQLVPFLRDAFASNSYAIVHSHVNTLSVFPLMAAKRAGVPIRIAHSHSTAGKGEYLRNCMKYSLRCFANVYPTMRIGCSRYAATWLFGDKVPFVILPNAIDTAWFKSEPDIRKRIRSEMGADDGTLVVGHIGRFMEQKNHAFLLKIFQALTAREPNCLLILAGTGPLLDRMKTLARELGVSDRVRFLGQRRDAGALYQGFDVFCLPSLYEGLPVVGVECQASGTPILASDAMTRETAMTGIMRFESLEAAPGQWADELIEMRSMHASPEDMQAVRQFDIHVNAAKLSGLYDSALRELDE